MTGDMVGSLILWLNVAIIFIVATVCLLSWLYYRSTREMAFVRTGFGGGKVMIYSGAFVLPIIHEVTRLTLIWHELWSPRPGKCSGQLGKQSG